MKIREIYKKCGKDIPKKLDVRDYDLKQEGEPNTVVFNKTRELFLETDIDITKLLGEGELRLKINNWLKDIDDQIDYIIDVDGEDVGVLIQAILSSLRESLKGER